MPDRPVPLDEYPIHQTARSMRHVATGDRNAYDRSIFHIFDHEGRALLITGFGVYPNLGVTDAYATLTRGSRLSAVRASDALGEDRMRQSVGPLRVEVLEPLKRLRLVCEGGPGELSYDLTWQAAFPAVEEPHHQQFSGDRLMLEAHRFVQAGGCEGVIRDGEREIPVAGGRWTATRDRSWGVRPVPGEAPGRAAVEFRPEGFHWLWIPIRFDDRFVMVIAQEDADGYRTLDAAVLVRPDGPDEQLGRAQADIAYRSGTRVPVSAVIHTDRGKIEAEVLASSPLAVGAGYPPARDWQHGEWKGRGWVDRRTYDLNDPAVLAPAAYGVTDHAARFTWDGATGYGIFEHGSFGRHTPSGFTGYESVAP